MNYAITGLIWVLLAFVLAAVVPSAVVAHPALAAAALMGCVVFAPGYMAEVVAARSIPLALVFWLVLLLVLLNALRKSGPSRHDFAQGCLMGAATGLGFLTRFDFLLPGGALLLVLAGLAWSDGRRRLLGGYSLVFLGLVGVWSAYSLVHFGVFLASDNARGVFRVFVPDQRREHAQQLMTTWTFRDVVDHSSTQDAERGRRSGESQPGAGPEEAVVMLLQSDSRSPPPTPEL